MVRNSHPHYLENVDRQRENMALDLDTALARLEDASRIKFDVRMEELIFPEKIWLICETNLLSRYMTWGDEEGVIMINLDEFEKGLLANQSTSHLFKTGKLVSFIRQFNLYDFKKKHDVFVDLKGDGTYLRFGLYYHEFLRPKVQSLLQNCSRKVNKKSSSYHHHRAAVDSGDSNDAPHQQGRKRRLVSGSPSSSMIIMDQDTSPEHNNNENKSSPKKFASAGRTGTHQSVPHILQHSLSAPATPQSKAYIPAARNRPVYCEELDSRKYMRELQRVYLVQRWTELPKEWSDLPEIQRQGIHQSAALINQYNWNLDPMQVGELASLATYGVTDDPFIPSFTMPEAEVPIWVEEVEAIQTLQEIERESGGYSYINL